METRDQHGDAVGGVRTPFVDIPIATYFPTSGAGERRVSGHKVLLDQAKLRNLCQNRAEYVANVAEEADSLVSERWLTRADAQSTKSAAEQADLR